MKEKDRIRIVDPVPAVDEGLRQWLASFIEKYPHLTTVQLSRREHIGVSKTGLDAYLDGTYFMPKESGGLGVSANSSKIEAQIRAYREKIEGTERHGYTNTFVDTRTYYRLQQACNTAITENAIVVVYGKPGVGKTRCLNQYITAKQQTRPVSILCSPNITVRYFVQKTATALGLDDRPPTAKLEDAIAEKLKRTPRPWFIDQANYLNEKSLGTICYVWEIARIPVVLVGTKDLHDLFTTSRLTEDVRAQLSSRVAMHYPLAELTTEEATAIIKRALGDDATDEDCAAIINITGGIHRHVDMILPRILELRKRNEKELTSGKVSMNGLITKAGLRLMTA